MPQPVTRTPSLTDSEPDHDAVRRGDPGTFALMVEVYSDRLYRLAFRMLGRSDAAEDVVQETFIAAFEARESFDGRASVYTWMHRIATNNALMRLRKRRRRGQMSSIDEDDVELRLPMEVHALPSDDLVHLEELQGLLQTWLDELPPLTRSVFVLRDLEDMPIGEVAVATDQTEWAAKGRLKRARAFLRNRLSDYLAGDL
jgi:RNA polymerase sigma-70 factor, ECF subfamily